MRRARHSGRRNRARRAFSLTELLLALGILAIGLSMAAALFPAAIRLNEQSGQDSIGTIVAENGLAVAQAQGATIRTALDANADCNTHLISVDLDPNLLLYHPDPNSTPTRGCIILAGRPTSLNLPYGVVRLVSVSYDKQSSTNIVNATYIPSPPLTITGGTVVNLGTNVPVGSPLILAADGSWAKIIDRNSSVSTQGTLDHALSTTTSEGAFVIVDPIATARSPATAVVVADVLLNP